MAQHSCLWRPDSELKSETFPPHSDETQPSTQNPKSSPHVAVMASRCGTNIPVCGGLDSESKNETFLLTTRVVVPRKREPSPLAVLPSCGGTNTPVCERFRFLPLPVGAPLAGVACGVLDLDSEVSCSRRWGPLRLCHCRYVPQVAQLRSCGTNIPVCGGPILNCSTGSREHQNHWSSVPQPFWL